jgi:hypothetical protein
MQKFILFFTLIFLSISSIYGANRSLNEAQIIALNFLNNRNNAQIQKAPASTKALHAVFTKAKSTDPNATYYYVFNKAENNGYIIVSGDERTVDVLAYADQGQFVAENMPENMKDWLRFYENEMDILEKTESKSAKVVALKNSDTNFAATVSPLLGSIKWNQGAPYNDLCPVIDQTTGEKAVTGCVATGMAQVMKYHQWPEKGVGSNSYTTNTNKITLSLDFSKTTFDWANMTNTYSNASTTAQKNAVATLMYNCGVAVNMDYAQSSGANTKTMANALKNNFGYNANLQFYSRNFFNRAEWINLLKTELNAARPILYSGYSNEAGHLFVCDGYDSNGLFHFNWGWGGTSDGYFQISALDPGEQGIGGSTGGYNGGQAIVTGLQKTTDGTSPSFLIHAGDTLQYSAKSVARSAVFTISAKKLFNQGVNTFAGNIALALYDSNNNFLQLIKNYSISELKANFGWNNLDFSSTAIDASVANGNYKIYAVYKGTNETDWQKIRSYVGTPNYLNVSISSSNIIFDTPSDKKPALTLNSISTTGNLYKNKTGRIKVSITNNGEEYNSVIAIYLQSKTNETTYQFISTENINFASGETRVLNFTGQITMEPGEYFMATMYNPTNNPDNAEYVTQLGNELIVNVLAEPSGSAILTLNSPISFTDPTKVNKSNAILSADLKNTGSLFDNKMIAFIFPESGGSSLTYIGYQDIIIDQNETRNVTFNGAVNLTPGRYFTVLYYMNAESKWTRLNPTEYSQLTFTLVNDYTDISNVSENNKLIVYPNPGRDQLHIEAIESIKSYSIFSMTGKVIENQLLNSTNKQSIDISNLKSGSYLIRIETASETKTLKFIKI